MDPCRPRWNNAEERASRSRSPGPEPKKMPKRKPAAKATPAPEPKTMPKRKPRQAPWPSNSASSNAPPAEPSASSNAPPAEPSASSNIPPEVPWAWPPGSAPPDNPATVDEALGTVGWEFWTPQQKQQWSEARQRWMAEEDAKQRARDPAMQHTLLFQIMFASQVAANLQKKLVEFAAESQLTRHLLHVLFQTSPEPAQLSCLILHIHRFFRAGPERGSYIGWLLRRYP